MVNEDKVDVFVSLVCGVLIGSKIDKVLFIPYAMAVSFTVQFPIGTITN